MNHLYQNGIADIWENYLMILKLEIKMIKLIFFKILERKPCKIANLVYFYIFKMYIIF